MLFIKLLFTLVLEYLLFFNLFLVCLDLEDVWYGLCHGSNSGLTSGNSLVLRSVGLFECCVCDLAATSTCFSSMPTAERSVCASSS